MKRINFTSWTSALAVVVLLTSGCGGCGGSGADNTQAENVQPKGSTAATVPHATNAAPHDEKPKASAEVTTASPWDALVKHDAAKDKAQAASPEPGKVTEADRNAPLVAAPGKEFKKAAVGMGEKGRGYGGGIITTPVKTYWTVKEQLALDLIQHAMDLYKADSDGKAPKTQAEFMKKIVKDNDIKLPELPEGCRYVYDPHTEELLVEQPKSP